MTTETTNDAKNQARAQLDSVTAMIERLNHAQTCNGNSCMVRSQEIIEGPGYHYHKNTYATHEQEDQYHDEDAARQAIEEDPLSVEVRSAWRSPGWVDDTDYGEYKILLCTGGPAVRITGTLSNDEPDSAVIEYQDWGTSWTELQVPRSEELTMIEYANCFYFGD